MFVAATGTVAELNPSSYLAVVITIAVLSQWTAWNLKVPSILLLLPAGFILGRFINPEAVLGQDVLFGGVTVAVGIILFEGSLSLRFRSVSDLGWPVIRLCSVTVLIAWPLTTAAVRLVGFDWQIAALAGALLVVTGPTVIAPILRLLRPQRRVASMLRWEGIVVDPIGAILAVLVFQGVLSGGLGQAFNHLMVLLLQMIGLSLTIAIGLGVVLEILMRRHAIPDFLHGVVFFAAALGALVGSNAILPESGLLTVTVLGIYLANRPKLHLEHVIEFKEHLQVLFVGALFVVLAGRIAPGDLLGILPQAVLVLLLLVAIIRPVSIWGGLWGTNTTREERTLLSFMAPRGIVAAAVASIFALEFEHAAEEFNRPDLTVLSEQMQQVVPLIFSIIVGTVAIYGLGVGRLAERLGLAKTSPQGVLFVGAQGWVLDAAKLLDEAGQTTLVVSRNFSEVSKARRAGLTANHVNILSDYAVRDMDLAGIGRLLACTPDDEVNATAAREFAHVLGRANVYQLQRAGAAGSATHSRTLLDRVLRRNKISASEATKTEAAHLTARLPFRPALTHDEMQERLDSGMVVKRTQLTEEFTLEDFQAYYGEESVLMFVVQGAELKVLGHGTKTPQTGATVIALVRLPEATQ